MHHRLDDNERIIAAAGGIGPIISCASSKSPELQSQAARALRNMSVDMRNKRRIVELGGYQILCALVNSNSERVIMQAQKALQNLRPVLDEQKRTSTKK